MLLLKSYENHWKEYGFISDLNSQTIYGLPVEQYRSGWEFKTEFVPNGTFTYSNGLKIALGTFNAYGKFNLDYAI